MTEQRHMSPAAFRHALTDRLRDLEKEGRSRLPQLQRQFAYDRLLQRLYRGLASHRPWSGTSGPPSEFAYTRIPNPVVSIDCPRAREASVASTKSAIRAAMESAQPSLRGRQ